VQLYDRPLVMMREREVSQSSVDAETTEYLLFGVSVLTCIKIKAGHCKSGREPAAPPKSRWGSVKPANETEAGL
jgi:hypothetical protein